MQVYLGISALCIISGILACIIHEVFYKDRSDINKDKSYINHIVKTTVFYAIMFHTVLAVCKTLLGNGTVTLIESFEGISWKTYFHYSLPLAVIAIVLPFILRKQFREKTDDFILMALSLIIGIDALVYLIFNEISNICSICIAAAGVGTAVLSVFFYKEKVCYCNRKSLKERLKLIAPIIAFWVILMILYLPNELYLGNIEDMYVPYGIFVGTLSLTGLAYFTIYTFASVYFLTDKQFSLMCELIFGISLSCYIQGMTLNGKMNIMDGSMQEWPIVTRVVNMVIWIAVIGLAVALKPILKKNMDKIYSMICIYLSLIQLVTWGYLGFSADVKGKAEDYELTTEARFELDSKHNVIVFVLDWFDGQILDSVIAEHEDVLEPLKDFTWYKNTTSLFSYTRMSLPYLLTNVEWQYDMAWDEYTSYAFSNGTLLNDIADRNYDIGIYTDKKCVSEDIDGIVRNYSDFAATGWDYSGIAGQMLECSKYKSYPFALKNIYWYADKDISGAMRETNIHSTADDGPFYTELIDNGIQVRSSNKYEGAYRFYHLHGMHIPFGPDMVSQGVFCMNIVDEYLKQLKDAGLYDEATIIITADHGQNYTLNEDMLELYGFDKPSSPILFVKSSGQTYEDGPVVSMAPVSHAEMAASIIKAVYGDTLGYGNAFDDIDEDAQRERYFTYRSRNGGIPYTKYAINGYVRDWSNWRLEISQESDE